MPRRSRSLNPKAELPKREEQAPEPSDRLRRHARTSSGTTYFFTNFDRSSRRHPTVWTTAPSKSAITRTAAATSAARATPGVAAAIAGQQVHDRLRRVLVHPAEPEAQGGRRDDPQQSHKSCPDPGWRSRRMRRRSRTSARRASRLLDRVQAGATSYPISGYTWAVVLASSRRAVEQGHASGEVPGLAVALGPGVAAPASRARTSRHSRATSPLPSQHPAARDTRRSWVVSGRPTRSCSRRPRTK